MQSYFDAIADGNAEDACSLGSEEFQEAAVVSVVGTPSEGETCEQTVANVPDEAREVVEGIEVTPVERNETEATVSASFESDGATVAPIPILLIREGDGWVIQGVVDETVDIPDVLGTSGPGGNQ